VSVNVDDVEGEFTKKNDSKRIVRVSIDMGVSVGESDFTDPLHTAALTITPSPSTWEGSTAGIPFMWTLPKTLFTAL
jgi:hypothetical protein